MTQGGAFSRPDMTSSILSVLVDRLKNEVHGIELKDEGLTAMLDLRYGPSRLQIDHDEEAESLRGAVEVPAPVGAGPDFLLWCLNMNTQYWDVKIGIDEDGQIIVHADLDVEEDEDPDALAGVLLDRIETITSLIDEDLTEWLLTHGFGTPPQRDRWQSRAKPT